jgi:hypothetical protein
MTKELYTQQANRALEAYIAVQPIHTEDRVVQEWLKRTTPNSPNIWELVKASAFYFDKHKHRLTLAFLVAGKELCYIKAMARSGSKVTVEDLYATYKPKKEKKAINKRQVPLPITESSESSEEEFFDAPGRTTRNQGDAVNHDHKICLILHKRRRYAWLEDHATSVQEALKDCQESVLKCGRLTSIHDSSQNITSHRRSLFSFLQLHISSSCPEWIFLCRNQCLIWLNLRTDR